MQDQFRERETGKTYLALVQGNWPEKLKVIDSSLLKYLLPDGERRVKVTAPDVPVEKYPALGERYRHYYMAHQNDLSLFEGVLPMLADLKSRHHWLTVATGKSRKGLNEALHDVELKGAFDGSRTADETAGKPSPLMLQELMREFGVEPERTLMIGDTTHDLQMALNAGCASVGVSYGAHEPSAFHALKPLFVAHSVAELRTWLLENA